MLRFGCLCLLLLSQILTPTARGEEASQWMLPEEDQAWWGRRDGLVFTIWPRGFYEAKHGNGGPRGLIRVGFMHEGRPQMLNFIAIEPIVAGNRAFSELEPSALDHAPGKRLWVFNPQTEDGQTPGEARPLPDRAVVRKTEDGAEIMEVGIGVEPFENGARMQLIARMDSRHPGELALSVQATTQSTTIERCILTATMGNFIRARQLWLGNRMVESTGIFADYTGINFTDHGIFGRDELLRRDGHLWAAITTNESTPSTVFPFAPENRWHYPGPPVTQYWHTRDDQPEEPCEIRVNGRYTYWRSERPIPGGIAYENFEVDRPFHPNQTFTFGISCKSPEELGFKSEANEQLLPGQASTEISKEE